MYGLAVIFLKIATQVNILKYFQQSFFFQI